jgi:glycosyltransferase involved in cell wall biosynthesis
MHVLFVHRAFPAQFGRLALELTRRYGWKCTCLIEHLSRCPSPAPEMLQQLELLPIPRPTGADQSPPWPQTYGRALEIGQAAFEAVRARPDLRPDLVVGHGGLVPTFFLREVLDCPIVDYCEYYFAAERRDLTYRLDLPPVEPAPFFPRCINATTLISLAACDAGYAPTSWQRQSFPRRFWPKIDVHSDGIDTQLYRPRSLPREVAGRSVAPQTRIVTFVARGLESMRGFDMFMDVAQRIVHARPDTLFVVVGDEETYYGWDDLRTGGPSFKEWVLSRGEYDLSRFLFLGHLEPERLAEVLCLSDLHLYLSVPFALSWSVLNALACGCVVLAGDVPPVREVIEPGRNGLIEPLFDRESLAETALQVLGDPDAFRPLGQAGRVLMEEKYSLDVAVEPLRAFFERVANWKCQAVPGAPPVPC